MRRARHAWLVVVLACGAGWPAVAASRTVSAPRSETRTYRSGDRAVAIDQWHPRERGRRGAVLLLHGRAGLQAYEARFTALGTSLVDEGFTVAVPHYFDATGSRAAPDVTPERFETWRRAIADALSFVAALPEVDPARVGVVGVSLGGFVGCAEAVRNDRVAALVSVSSGVSTWFPRAPRRMPPLLIVHAAGDPIAPLGDALRLAEIARKLGVEPELAIYERSEHLLTGDVAELAEDRIVAFLTTTLRARSVRPERRPAGP